MLDLPSSAKQVKDRIKSDIRIVLPIANPFVAGEWLGTLADAFGERIFSFYYAITQLISELFPDTTNMFVERWANLYNLSIKTATTSQGVWYYSGSIGTNPARVDVGSVLVDANGNTFETIETTSLASVVGSANNGSWSRISTDSTIFTVVIADSNLPTGASIGIFGSVVLPALNGTHIVTSISLNSVSITVPSAAGAAGTSGNFNASYNSAKTFIRSLSTGTEINLAPLSALTLQQSVLGVTSLGNIDEAGLTGAVSQETLESLRGRLLSRLRNPVANFNVAEIESLVLQQDAITRVFVQPVTPAIGQVTIYPIIDGGVVPIPSPAQNAAIKQAIIDDIKPANLSDADLFVSEATTISVAVTLATLSPNTVGMQSAITSSLRQLFQTQAGVGIALTVDDIRSAINGAIDISTGSPVFTFSVSAPGVDIPAVSNSIPILGTVTFPVIP